MINIKEFRVDKIVLLLSVIRKMKQIPFERDARFYKVIQAAKVFTNNPDIYKELLEDKELITNLSQILSSNSFQNLYDEALSYRDAVASRWKKLEPIIRDYCAKTLGLTEEKDILANIVNPRFNTGTNNMKNEIFFGHMNGEKDISYDATYIMHEAMHCKFPRQKEWSEEQYGICHSLIELAIDNELMSRLGGNNCNYGQGHHGGEKIRKRLMPLWITYLSKKGGALNFEVPTDEEFRKYMNIAQSNDVQNMNFTDLMEYCIEHYQEYGLDKNTFIIKKKNEVQCDGEEI